MSGLSMYRAALGSTIKSNTANWGAASTLLTNTANVLAQKYNVRERVIHTSRVNDLKLKAKDMEKPQPLT
jgi:hypothetical protein